MIITEKWLREWIDTPLKIDEIGKRLTLAGLEVASITPVSDKLDGVVVGEIKRLERHPQADQLNVCEVAVGKGKTLPIVCGARNARVGLKAPVAQIGARLPNDVVIREANLRGVVSQGMLCSASELGLEESSSGLLELAADAKTGQSFYRHFELDDTRLEIELTPNRGDCLSIVGIARELAALTGGKLRAAKAVTIKPAKVAAKLPIKIEAGEDCPRYVGQAMIGIDPNAKSPSWLTERLRRSGIRSIHPVVDVTNYVMLELGQPMHAFDLGKLQGGIAVRRAHAGEKLVLLDGNEIELPAKSLVIADRTRALALAGVMGGQGSGVGSSTTEIFLESAYFRAETIGRQARARGLHTESSHRFERGVDFTLQERAMSRAVSLLRDIVGGKPGAVQVIEARKSIPKLPSITLRAARCEQLLGAPLSAAEIRKILAQLGMKTTPVGKGWRVVPPAYRFDVRQECDLIEEIARVHGYEKLPSRLPIINMEQASAPETVLPELRLCEVLVDREYQEAITYSFVDAKRQHLLAPGAEAVALKNPLSSEMAVMRSSLWPGLVEAVAYNLNRQQNRVRLFEIGRRFQPTEKGVRQPKTLAGAITGSALAEQWGSPARATDFFDAKGDVEAVLALTGRWFSFHAAQHVALHPGQSAAIYVDDGQVVGWLGRLHPDIQSELGLDQPVFLFELELDQICQAIAPNFAEISKFPSIRRDLAVIVGVDTPAADVLAETARAAGKLLVNLELFDDYRGEGIDSGRKSLGLALTLQDYSLTLKEEVVEALVAQVVAALQTKFHAQLRQ